MTATDINSIPQQKSERRGIFARLREAFVFFAESKHRIGRIEELNALTDKQLEARGLRREDITRHVFRDLLHT